MKFKSFIDEIVIGLKPFWIFASMDDIRTHNQIEDLSNFAFNKKILNGVTLLKIKIGATWTQSIYIKYAF